MGLSGPIFCGLSGLSLTGNEALALERPSVGGVVLFSRNYSDRKQLKALIRDIRAVRGELIISVDQEGGRVQRFKEGFTRLPAVSTLTTTQAARQWGYTMASELKAVGLDLSFAPVLDLDYGHNDVIGNRSFGADPERVVELADAFIEGMSQADMPAVGKHFPGHGFVSVDSHAQLPVDERAWEVIVARDMQPFKQLAPKLMGIMTAHILFPHVDSKIVTFSSYWLKQILREEIGFEGLIFSDDLSMGAVRDSGDPVVLISKAHDAGCDVTLVCNDLYST